MRLCAQKQTLFQDKDVALAFRWSLHKLPRLALLANHDGTIVATVELSDL